jgi:hypothetical protein
MKYYEPQNFKLQELIPPDIYQEFGDKALFLLDQNMVKMVDGVRNFFGVPVTINNWHIKGSFTLRGFRPSDTSVGVKYSQHKYGRAADMDIQGYTAEDARQAILKNQKSPLLNWITVIEDKVNWLHADCRNIKTEQIILVQP